MRTVMEFVSQRMTLRNLALEDHPDIVEITPPVDAHHA